MFKIGDVPGGRYMIWDTIGKGGTSTVYLARDINIGKLWAVKHIHSQQGSAFYLAHRETEIMKSIDHPLFPRIVDAWNDADGSCIVSDYIDGLSLDKVLMKGPVMKAGAVRWAIDIADGLTYLHEHDPVILYLDMKPANVMLCGDGSVRLIDMGIAGYLSGHRECFGTPGYAPPEQYLTDEGAVSERTDIYSFGMMYLTMRTGIPPDKDAFVNIDRIRKSHKLDRKEKTFLLRCCATDPSMRYGSMREVSEVLLHFRTNPIKKNRLLIITAAAFAIVAALVTGARIYREALRERAAEQLIEATTDYIEDGEYTKEGIRIIEAFIESGCLSDEAAQHYMYEVACNYFLLRSDYRTAGYYFGKLSEEQHPQKDYYLKLCELENGFDVNEDEVEECLKKMYGELLLSNDGDRTIKGMIFVAACYEKYFGPAGDGFLKARTVLNEGMSRVDETTSQYIKDELDNEKEKLEEILRL